MWRKILAFTWWCFVALRVLAELRNMSPRDFQKTVESLREDALALKFDEGATRKNRELINC